MPLKVGELYSTMRLDNREFDTALDASGRKFEALGKTLGNGTKAVAQVFAATTTAAAGLGVAALKVGLDYNRMQQTSRAALKSILGSTEAVNEQMGKLDEFASKSPFSKQTFISAQQQMLAFGIETQKVLPYLDAVQQAVAATGGNSQQVGDLAFIMAQISAAGKVTGQDLMQFGQRGVNAAELVGSAMGKTGVEIKESISKGTITADEFLDALAQGMSTKFDGATANIKAQFDGAADRVKAAWREIGATMAKPLIDPSGGGQLVVWTNLFADALRALSKQAIPVVDLLWGRFAPGIDFVTSSLKKATGAISGWNIRGLEDSLDSLSKYTPLIAGVSTALFTLGTGSVPILRNLGLAGINPVLAGILALVAASPQLRGVGANFIKALQPAIKPATELATIVGDFLTSALNILTPTLGDVATSGADLAVLFVQSLVPAVKGTTDVALPLIQAAANLASFLTRLPTPILATVAALAAMKALGLTQVFNGLPAALKNVGAGFSTLHARTVTAAYGMGPLTKEASAATSGLGMLGTAAKATSASLKAAFMSNLPMLAITALVGALTYFSQQAAEAKVRAESYRDALKGITAGSKEATQTVVDLATKLALTGDGVRWGLLEKLGAGASTLSEALEKAGSTAKEFGEAVAGSDTQVAAYEQKLMAGAIASGLSVVATSRMLDEFHKQVKAYRDGADITAKLTDKTKELAEADRKATEAKKEAIAASDRLRQAEQNLAAAKGDLKMAQYAATDALTDWVAKVQEAGGVQTDQDGNLVRSGEAWRAYTEGAVRSQHALMTVLDDMVKAGATQEELDKARLDGIASWDQTSASMGVAGDATKAYLEEIGGIPEYKSTIIDLRTDDAEGKVDDLFAEISASHPKMQIDARNDPAMAELMSTLGLVEGESGQFALDADGNPALTKLLLTLGVVDTSTGTIKMDGNSKPGEEVLYKLVEAVNGKNPKVEVGVRDGTIEPVAQIVADINAKTATIKVSAVGSRAQMTGIVQADGGIVRYYGQGGFENHVAQIARAGEFRVWAEDETGGEAYIPLAASKRARSLAILDEVAANFGYQLIGAGARSFANGDAGTHFQQHNVPAGVHVDNVNVSVDWGKVKDIRDVIDFLSRLGLLDQMQGAA